ncbi:UV-endonuclease UvdE-domain-containing protein [Xylariaceae sp. FL1019]|nr:UV-endonuclease UvdE-domain-containing protein [Xylariaceae sp. FL1019]
MGGTQRHLIRWYRARPTCHGRFSPAISVHYIHYCSRAANPKPFPMAPKRKSSEMALMSPMSPTYSPAGNHADTGLRRSGRLVDKGGHDIKGFAADVEDVDMATDDNSASRKRAVKRKKGVNVAINGLKEMEGRLQNVVKTQKLALEESSMESKDSHDIQRAVFTPRSHKDKPDTMEARKRQSKRAAQKKKADKDDSSEQTGPDAADDPGPTARPQDDDYVPDETDISNLKLEGARPPPVNSDYLPLPWKGRLGYACLNTYLRQSNPPVFSSRTCRIASIIEHRHPLADPSQPEHPTKNRPDKDQPADIARGQRYVEALGLANARDIIKMLRWNDKYGIKFMRLSSEMFPFASHDTYGYKLAPFASQVLAEAGKVASELGHRLTTHPGQFTQLGSPRKEVVENAVRDLEYHNEMLSLLKLSEQTNKDAVMILHMGGVFGDKAATLDRFRENYAKLSPEIKARLVLENDDVSWTVHDLLPICEELDIPMVLDFHHHNIMFDEDKIREGTKDIMDLYPRIKATWDRKGITQKMHYSEQCSEAVTRRQRRKHRPRVMTLPPCSDTMDLMIEAKDKEQAVFDLMRNYRLPGWDLINDVVPYEREDENRTVAKPPKKKQKKRKGKEEDIDEEEVEEEVKPPPEVPESQLGMGGPNNRVYWPLGMEEWLRPKKREVKKKDKAKSDKETTID